MDLHEVANTLDHLRAQVKRLHQQLPPCGSGFEVRVGDLVHQLLAVRDEAFVAVQRPRPNDDD